MRALGTAILGFASVFALAGMALAQLVEFELPSEDLKVALDTFIVKAGVQLVYSVDDVKGRSSHAVHGNLTVEQALDRLLENSGVFASRDASGAFIVSQLRDDDDVPAVSYGAIFETVTVTGSRLITDGNSSPTPVTVVSVDQLLATTPSNVFDALKKMPVFLGSRGPRTTGGASQNWPASVLNLRNFGTSRTLILFNGNRVATTSVTGDTDINTLPQDLIERVDVVTGGASSVYGTDAITGVVNFVIDSKFNGFRANAQSGISSYSDNASWKVSLVGGMDILGNRGHAEFSFNHFSSDGIPTMMTRPNGPKIYTEPGSGTVANPYRLVANSRLPNYASGGFISTGVLADTFFCSNGVLCPFTHGGATGTANDEIGGDGGYGGEALDGVDANPWLVASLKSSQFFGRFDYDLTGSTHAYAQLSLTEASNFNVAFPNNYVMNYAADNAYLPASARALLSAANEAAFTMGRAIQNQVGGVSKAYTSGLSLTVGANGTLFDDYKWDVHYTHSKNVLNESSPYNGNRQRLYAASDAVVDPATGAIVCRVSLTAYAAQYPGCIPLNAFGPTATTDKAFRYVTDDTVWKGKNGMDDIGVNISGTLAALWAGPLKLALSAEWHNISLGINSQYDPIRKVDCSTLNPLVCDPTKAVFNNVVAPLDQVSEDISEVAAEIGVPLLKDLPIAQKVDFSGVLRYARYSVSGDAFTWKLGLVWDVTDDLTFRGTQSRDIRAPTLNNMFAPVAANITAFNDYLTGTTGNLVLESMGNRSLRPEVAQTATAGAVYRPSWLQGFSISADWYEIIIRNAIASVNGGSASAEKQCIVSGGTSPFCALVIRPYPLSNSTPANFPTLVLSEALNISKTSTHGIDLELNYTTELGQVDARLDGTLAMRLLGSYQPSILSQAMPGAVITNAAGAAGTLGNGGGAKRIAFIANYSRGPISVDLMERWQSGVRQSSDPTLIFETPNVPSIAYTDLSVGYKVSFSNRDESKNAELFLSVENLLNQQPHIWIPTGNSAAQGYAYPAPSDEDAVGRYFTIGIRYKM